MGKIKIRTGRGTGTREIDDDKKGWAGDEYKKIQDEKKKQAANRMIHTGRGTGSKRLGDLPDSKPRPSTEGMTRITGRGTGSRKSTNKGSS
ncbi:MULTISPECIES: hypothetical protein [Nitrosarchaeum]|jgi:hypothetical protein|uniref:Uncharacterized protein n=1 Tax=Nitrosarchaeum koreense MY1 TaxID=1001994 RepID=F9CU27_9ARCH|nr:MULTISPECIES: hypothetical protein [Nitrosarchaeum]EGP93030.1 hypothetical protein MY1_0256 [Nitrosarchaeum koreense MY1]MCV0412060.1 hypothetical protein [Nitrosarchaeum sp.]QLH10370.1 hypothetical protein DSQ20_01760 [Nitrosarchaeum sp. AC2]